MPVKEGSSGRSRVKDGHRAPVKDLSSAKRKGQSALKVIVERKAFQILESASSQLAKITSDRSVPKTKRDIKKEFQKFTLKRIDVATKTGKLSSKTARSETAMLAAEAILHALDSDDVEAAVALDSIVARGLEIQTVVEIPKILDLMVAHNVLPKSTLQHNAKGDRLSSANSERFVRVLRLRKLAIEAFGETPADSWLASPLRMLEGRTPMSMMSTEAGARAVEQLIERTMHGFNA